MKRSLKTLLIIFIIVLVGGGLLSLYKSDFYQNKLTASTYEFDDQNTSIKTVLINAKNIKFEDSNLWYRTQKENEFKNKDGGIETDVNSSELNAIYFKDTYKNCFWYKK